MRAAVVALLLSCTPGPARVVESVVSPPAVASAPVASIAPPAASTSASIVVVEPPPPPVEEDPGDLIATPAEKKAALEAAIVKTDDLTLGKVKILGPCFKTKRHAAIVNNTAGTKGNLGFPMVDASVLVDLDGDGTADELLFMGATNITVRYEIYVLRGGCGYHLGAIETEANLGATTTKTNGVFDLEGDRACRINCCPTTERLHYAFNGKKYALTKTTKVKQTCGKDDDLFH